MIFATIDIEEPLSENLSFSFSLEGFTIFANGKDGLPHIVCTCPNKSTARAFYGLPGICGYLTGDAALVPQVLATGQTVLAIMTTLNDDTIFKDGVGVGIEEEFIEASTAGYVEFIEKLRKA